jgi:TetR/AcrR family transcriptional repressor of nem operon
LVPKRPKGEKRPTDLIGAAIMVRWRQWTDALAECLADGQRDGSVRADVPVTELARTVLALWEGAVLSAKLERRPQPLKIARRTLQRLLAP